MKQNVFRTLFVLLFALQPAASAYAATAEETLVVYNKRMSGSRDIASYYMQKRGIPGDNLLATSLTLKEEMSREEFNRKLRKPIRKKMDKLLPDTTISSIVLIYGVPLKVLPPELNWDQEETLENLVAEKKSLDSKGEKDSARAKVIGELIRELKGTDQRASVDSELMLINRESYPLLGWLENPHFQGFHRKLNTTMKVARADVILVSRLDGPDKETVYRLINDALEAEKTGLHGKAYFDASWPRPESENVHSYDLWDLSLHKAAESVKDIMEVHVEQTRKLIPVGGAPEAALYAGWYSLANYVDSFTWVKGAVGYHIASDECKTLKKPDSQVWCLQMLKRGVAATIGPVWEPYVQGFPLPEVFFENFISGRNLGESYLVSLPFISWQMVLVGDPLYSPFANPAGK